MWIHLNPFLFLPWWCWFSLAFPCRFHVGLNTEQFGHKKVEYFLNYDKRRKRALHNSFGLKHVWECQCSTTILWEVQWNSDYRSWVLKSDRAMHLLQAWKSRKVGHSNFYICWWFFNQRKEVENGTFFRQFIGYLKIERLGWLKKYLGVWWQWKEDPETKKSKATMPKIMHEFKKPTQMLWDSQQSQWRLLVALASKYLRSFTTDEKDIKVTEC